MRTGVPLFSAESANSDLDFHAPIERVLNSHWYILGREVTAFEEAFANYCGVAHCVGLANGSDALELALRACGVSNGDQVILTANAGFYGSAAVRSIGAVPVYVDVDPSTMNLSATELESQIKKTSARAIIVTHLYGRMAEIEKIARLARTCDIPLIEDCAQSHGARYRGSHAGSFGDIGCFSFYPTKNLGALGDGGAIVTNDGDMADRIRQLRQYGWGEKYRVTLGGGRNSRLDEIQAAILSSKLPLLDSWNRRRQEIAEKYNLAFADLPILLPKAPGEDYVAHLYVMQVDNRTNFRAHLSGQGVSSEIHYPVPDHRQEVYIKETASISLPVTERVCESVVTIPCFPGLTDSDTDHVIAAVQSHFETA